MAKVFIEETTLTAIGDAIRGKEGTTELIPVPDMATRISAIQGGGGGNEPTAEDLTFTGNLSSTFAGASWNWVINKYSDKMSFYNVSSSQNMFSSNPITDLSMLTIPFATNANPQSMFNGCNKLTKLPKVSGAIDRYIYNIFGGCYSLPDEEINNFFKDLTVNETSTSTSYHGVFTGCASARNIDEALDWLQTHVNSYTGTYSSFVNYNNIINSCYSLDAVVLPVFNSSKAPRTSNAFGGALQNCTRVKDVKFKTDNGVPYEVQWKNQTIDLKSVYYVGWCPAGYRAYLLDYNSGITADKEVKNDATYQALKNDPDWFASHADYSRYNHDSAVNTINTLPDTSAYLATAGGTNTIAFTGANGSKTDGGAINTLTAEEIAVATAKGWTVTLV